MKSYYVLFIFASAVLAQADENSQNIQVSEIGSVRHTRAVSGCSYDGCNQFCRKQGHARGVCIGSYCQCRFRRRRSVTDTQPIQDHAIAPIPSRQTREARSCGYDECNQFCRKLGHARGVCIGSYCQCRARLRRSVTDFETLQQDCRKRGYRNGGYCTLNGCVCK